MNIEAAGQPTAQQLAAMSTYCDLMDEVWARMQWIDYAVNGRTGMFPQIVLETCHLQMRMIVELVALGCLVAHGDIEETKGRLRRTWSADEILNGLERLHPDFFPIPLQEAPLGSSGQRQFLPVREQCMTKAELLDLYRRQCGNSLHRGSLKNLLGPRRPVRKGYPEVIEPTQKILNLLAFHQLYLADGNSLMLCHLVDPVDQRAKVSFAQAVGPWSNPP